MIEVSEINSEASCGLRGHFEVATSEATKKITRGNIHMDSRVFDIADLKCEVIFSLPPLHTGIKGHRPLVTLEKGPIMLVWLAITFSNGGENIALLAPRKP